MACSCSFPFYLIMFNESISYLCDALLQMSGQRVECCFCGSVVVASRRRRYQRGNSLDISSVLFYLTQVFTFKITQLKNFFFSLCFDVMMIDMFLKIYASTYNYNTHHYYYFQVNTMLCLCDENSCILAQAIIAHCTCISSPRISL